MPNSANPAQFNSATNLDPDLQLAIEQASAPNLTQSERLHKLLESVSAPTLTTNAPQNARLNPDKQAIQAIQDFQSSPGYSNFKATVQKTLQQLDTIARSSPRPGQESKPFERFGKDVFVTISGNKRSRFGSTQADLLVQSCPDASRILRMHTFAKKRPDLVASGGADSARACITELSQRLGVCGPGIVQHFDEAVKTIRQLTFVPSMPERAEALRIQIVRNAITEYLNRPGVTCKMIGSEVHQVAAWQNHFSSLFDLPTIRDVYANPNFTENEQEQIELASKLSALQSGSVISTMLANQILEEAQDIWQHAQAKGINDLSQYCMTLLDKINERHGQVEPHALLVLDEDGMPHAIQNDPTLLALSIIGQANQTTDVHFVKESVREWTPSNQNAYGHISLKSRGQLNWLETAPPPGSTDKPEQELMSAASMTGQQVTELIDAVLAPGQHELDVREAMHTIMQNDWGRTWPAILSKTHQKFNPNDVLVNLAFGMVKDQKLGPIELKTEFKKLMTKALSQFEYSTVLDTYSENEIYELLEYITDMNEASENPGDHVDLRQLLDSVRYNHETSDIPLYKAVHRHEWKHNYDLSFRKSYAPALIRGQGTKHAMAYIEAMATAVPHLLGRTLRRNAPAMTDPEVVFKFLKMGANLHTVPNQGVDALRRLRLHKNDDFLFTVLKGLVQRKYSIRDIAHTYSIRALRNRGMKKTAAYLDRFCYDRIVGPTQYHKLVIADPKNLDDLDPIEAFYENLSFTEHADLATRKPLRGY